ncbi:hypothetical protein HNP46_000386 [Pseudomonas nitritireducens]|uniref:Uncharacterized protein n=1 Tax=Pseudomonas nitroreducens TaxID=46680 RepID=A0A7W7NZR1_PSENT|nr:hypothetical protein [Pseudomonas nitritireducens]MBB4861575.1 hypothetical protein [Pseudomonas nitritireducens]
MAQQPQYRVVKTNIGSSGRAEEPVTDWMSESAAKKQMAELKKARPKDWLSIQKSTNQVKKQSH